MPFNDTLTLMFNPLKTLSFLAVIDHNNEDNQQTWKIRNKENGLEFTNHNQSHEVVKVKNPIPPTRRPTRRSTHHQHTTDTLADTLMGTGL